MIETVLITVAAIGSVLGPHEMPVAKPQMVVAEAAVATPTPTPTPEPVVEEPVEPETIETQEAPAEAFYSEPQEDLPTPADEFAYSEMQLLGTYHITHYSLEECGNCIGAAEVPGGMVEGLSCAMPEKWMLGHTVLIEGYGFFRVDDISPDGIADIFHYDAASAVDEDWQNVYLVD